MNREEGRLKMAELAMIENQLAELDARRAQLSARKAAIFSALAEGETVDLRTMRKPPTPHRAAIGEVSEVDRARARAALRETENRRRVGR